MVMHNEVEVFRPIGPTEARLNVTWGQNADLPQVVDFGLPDDSLKALAAEAIRGGFPGIPADPDVDLSTFVVDRFGPTEARPWNMVSIRPKTEFGLPL